MKGTEFDLTCDERLVADRGAPADPRLPAPARRSEACFSSLQDVRGTQRLRVLFEPTF